MSKWFKITGLLLVVTIALFAVASVAYAQGPRNGSGRCPGCGMGMGGNEYSLVAVAAKTLGVEQQALVAELNEGKTIADVAKAKGVELDEIVDAFVAQHQAMMAVMVTNGRMTQEQVDARLAVMKSNVTAQLSQKFDPNSNGLGFVDANGDGVCDHAGTMMNGMMGGKMGGGMMGGMGHRGGGWNNQAQ